MYHELHSTKLLKVEGQMLLCSRKPRFSKRRTGNTFLAGHDVVLSFKKIACTNSRSNSYLKMRSGLRKL